MTTLIKTLLLIANVVSFVLTILFAVFGIYERIVGPNDVKELLKKINFSLSYKQIVVLGVVCAVVAAITRILYLNLSGRL